jgi:hypothetical protein
MRERVLQCLRPIMPWQKNLGPAPPLVIPTMNDLWLVAEKLARKVAVLQGVIDSQARPKPERQAQKGGWQLDRIKEVLQTLYPPDGRPPSNLTDKAIQRLLVPVF